MKAIPTLEILIPTYSRDRAAELAILSCLEVINSNIRVRCNSNGKSDYLKRLFHEKYENVIFTEFDENLGALKNIIYLLENSNAEYCTLLSDEDSIQGSLIDDFIGFLNNLPADVAVVSCSASEVNLNSPTYASFFNISALLSGNDFFSTGGPISTYLSGYTFRTEYFKKINLSRYSDAVTGNAYPHLSLVYDLMELGGFATYQRRFILKGEDILSGGDGYSHLRDGDVITLNPSVYGPKARIIQYNFANKELSSKKLSVLQSIMMKVGIFLFFGRAFTSSKAFVAAEYGRLPGVQGYFAYIESYRAGILIFNFYSVLMFIFLFLPNIFRRILLRIFEFLYVKLQRRILLRIIKASSKQDFFYGRHI